MRALSLRSSRATPLKLVAGAIAAASIAGAAQADTISYNSSLIDPPGVYFGSGNPNTGWTVNETTGGIELGLDVLKRKQSAVAPTTGNVYYVDTGYYSYTSDFCTGICAIWNFSFSVNLQADTASTAYDRSNITANLFVQNLGNGTTLSFDPNLIGDNASVDVYTFQNSENLSFFSGAPGWSFDPLADDTYIITLSLFGPQGENLGAIEEIVIAGAGAAPIPAALPLFASGLGLLGFAAHRRKRNKARAVA
jgi:hypothetical protein